MEASQVKDGEARLVRGFLPARYGTSYLTHLAERLGDPSDPNMTGRSILWYRDPRRASNPDIQAGWDKRSRLIALTWYNARMYALRMRGAHQYVETRYVASADVPSPYPSEEYDLASVPQVSDQYARLIWVQYRDEVFFCWGPASSVKRLYVDDAGVLHIYKCGIVAPVAASSAFADTTGTGLVAETAYTYRLCWADEKYRLSSPGPDEAHTTAALKERVTCTVTWPTDEQVRYAVLYRAAQGTTNYYAVTPVSATSVYIARTTATTTTADDGTAEADLVIGDLCPAPGANDPPNLASALCIHNNRLCLSDRSFGSLISWGEPDYSDEASLLRVQMSNLNAPTQFNSVSDVDDESLGTSLYVGTDVGDRVIALGSIGSILGVWRERSFYYITGSNPTDWSVEAGPNVGCVNPAALCFMQGRPFWLAEDGVYTFADGLRPVNVSLRVSNYFGGAAVGRRGSIEETG